MKRVGIKDVAAQAGVSMSSVSNALNRPERVSGDIVQRVRAAVDELGYVPLQAAQQLRIGRSGLLGMTVINITNPFFAELVSGAEDAAGKGVRVLVGNSDASYADAAEVLAWLFGIPGLVLSLYATVLYIPMARRALAEGRAEAAAR